MYDGGTADRLVAAKMTEAPHSNSGRQKMGVERLVAIAGVVVAADVM